MTAKSLTQAEAARRLKISTRMLRQHSTDGKIPRNADGSYPWPKIRHAYAALKKAETTARAAGFGDAGYQHERTRIAKEKADRAEQENRIRRRELLEAADVDELLRVPLERTNTIIENVPSRYAPMLAKRSGLSLAEAKRFLSEVVDAVRAEIRAAPRGDDAAAA